MNCLSAPRNGLVVVLCLDAVCVVRNGLVLCPVCRCSMALYGSIIPRYGEVHWKDSNVGQLLAS